MDFCGLGELGHLNIRCLLILSGVHRFDVFTWRGDGVSGEGHVEGRLISQRRRVHPSTDEEAGAAAEQYAHHQQHPVMKPRKKSGWRIGKYMFGMRF